jgi:hypothetical protein
MSELEIALLRAGLVAIALVTATDFERRNGEVPNLVPLAALVAGLVTGAATGQLAPTLGTTALLGVPAVVAYTRGALKPDAAKLTLGLGACLGAAGALVTLALGAIWVLALARRREAWRRLQRPEPRLASSPRIAVFAGLGAATGIVASLAP